MTVVMLCETYKVSALIVMAALVNIASVIHVSMASYGRKIASSVGEVTDR